MFGLLQVFNQSDLTLNDFEQIKGCEIESLKSIASSKRQLRFLQILSKSQQFIVWLQKEANGEYISSYMYYSTAHIQVYNKTRVMIRASRNFAFNLRIGFVRHEKILLASDN